MKLENYKSQSYKNALIMSGICLSLKKKSMGETLLFSLFNVQLAR